MFNDINKILNDIYNGNESYYHLRYKYLNTRYPDFCDFINDKYSHVEKWSEKLYLYYKGLENPSVCKICGKPVNFINFYNGYHKYCSRMCSNNDPEVRQKTVETFRKKYGCDHPFQTAEVREKYKKTFLERYGENNPLKIKKIWDKIKQTNLERYGTTNVMKCSDIIEKVHHTNLERYGVENPMQLKEIQEKVRQTNLERYGKEWIVEMIDVVSKEEIKLQDYIESLSYIINRNDRSIVKGFELDIYIPNLNIAIEYNGCYWHSTINKDKQYHMNKWRACYNTGIELISIWESWDTDIVYRFLKNKLEGSDIILYKNLIFPDLIEWPLDLGYPNFKIDINNIKEHKCIYNGFECYDSGIVKI